MTSVASISTGDGIKDFSSRKNVQFKIDDDVFDGVPEIGAMILIEYMVIAEGISETNVAGQGGAYTSLVTMLLTEQSSARFIERMSSKTEPISIEQVTEIMPWLMEQYGMRPTTPSEDSSGGSDNPDGGTNSTETARVVELIPPPSPPVDS